MSDGYRIGGITVTNEAPLDLILTRYYDGTPAIRIMDSVGRPYATLSVNPPEHRLEPGEIAIKTWAENRWIVETCRRSGIFVDTGKRIPMGHVSAEVWRLSSQTT